VIEFDQWLIAEDESQAVLGEQRSSPSRIRHSNHRGG
jgi:hypothetical protein